MSVQKDSRREGRLSLATLARSHAKYVIQITKNPKVFDPAYSDSVTDDIIRQAKDINRQIWAANNVLVNSPEDYKLRRQHQEKAALLCNTLLADMEIAQSVFHLFSDDELPSVAIERMSKHRDAAARKHALDRFLR